MSKANHVDCLGKAHAHIIADGPVSFNNIRAYLERQAIGVDCENSWTITVDVITSLMEDRLIDCDLDDDTYMIR